MKVNDTDCYRLVDSGAALSLCSRELLGSNQIFDTENMVKIRGVSGSFLNVLGKTTVSCKIGNLSLDLDVTVVDKMADSVFIIGRDILEPHQCVINYRQLTLTIGNHSVPLLKAYSGKNLKNPMSLHCSQTYVIPAYTSCVTKFHLRSKRPQQSTKLYISITGALEPSQTFSPEALVPDGLLNTNRGSTTIQIFNMADRPLCIYKNKRIGSFSTFHSSELNTLNVELVVPVKQDSDQQDSNLLVTNTPTKSNYTALKSSVPKTSEANFNSRAGISHIVNKIDKLCTDNKYNTGSHVNLEPSPRTQKLNVSTVHDDVRSLGSKVQSDTKQQSPGQQSSEQCSAGVAVHERWKDNISDLYKLLHIDELDHLTHEQKLKVKELISEFRGIFAEDQNDMGCTDLAEQEIILKDQTPVRSKYYNVPLALKAKAEKEVKRLMDLKIIEPSTSTWHSPSFVMTKPDGSLRLLTDYRLLNAKILRTYAPVPALQDLVALWDKCTLYTTLDFQFGFFQSPISPKSRPDTATSLPGIAFFQYLRSPMGLSSSPGFFQSLVEKLLMGLKQSRCVAFLDDILSGSVTFDEHVINLRAVFERIRESRMLLKPSKSKIFHQKLRYLGHVLSEEGISTCPEKVESIKKMVPPKNVTGVKSFLGLSGFYRRFIRDYAKLAEPLSKMTKKNVKFEWTPEAEKSWQTNKDKLASGCKWLQINPGYHRFNH